MSERLRHTRAACSLAAGAMTIGCGEGGRDDGFFGEGSQTTVTASAGGDATSTSGADGSGSGGPSPATGSDPTSGPADTAAEGVVFDLPSGESGADGGSPGMGCTKVDFLFVIDNSGSMEDEQQNLANSFAGFIAGIQDVVEAQDYHILVTDSDADVAGGCPGQPGQPAPPAACMTYCAACSTNCEPCTCNGMACPPSPSCDATLGAGQNTDVDGMSCSVAGDARYMTQDQPNLLGTFSCIALVGTNGDGNELPMAAADEAINALAGAGQCNEGFLRDDAILVVTVISDEEDIGKSPGDPASWAQAIIAAKQGTETAVVALAIVGDNGIPNGVCVGAPQNGGAGAQDSPRLRAWAEMFTYGQWGSVCAADYAPFFQDAVSVIDVACDNFEPEG